METVDKIRVLIVDDHAILRSGVRMLLDTEGDIEVVGEAESAETAVERARELSPDVVLLDISMPGGSGIQAIEQVRGVSPGSRVIILTMHDDQAYLRSALASGASGYMVKTGADGELVNAIRTVYRGRSYVDVSLGEASAHPVLAERRRAGTPADQLSSRERQVLEFVAYGHTHKEIAARLSVSVKSVETYRARVADKLGLRSRAELVRYALDHGLLGPDSVPTVDKA
jgi:DNA-binding NarL/FixJ family response regulator